MTIYGVAIVFFLSALDQTVVTTAMPRIVAELDGLTLYAWVTTAYLLTSTVMVPIWGKLGDLYGRKPILLSAICIFMIGSWLSGLSGEFSDLPLLGGGMTQLIFFRAIQGIGGAALFVTAFAIIGDLYPPRERGRLSGLFGAVFGLSSTIGPLIGGYFTDHGTVTLMGHAIAGWRWVFYINLPLSILSLFMIVTKMPKFSHAAKGKVDYIGALLIVITTVPVLLALSFGGRTYPWSSPVVIALLSVAAVSLWLYFVAEKRATDPILPISLFQNRVFWTANAAGFLLSMAFMGTVVFLQLFMQLGLGVRATTSGLLSLPLMLGLIGSSIVCGIVVTRTGKYKCPMLLGALVTGVGLLLLSRTDVHTSHPDIAWRMLVLGIGVGPGQTLFNLVIQNALPPDQLGVATSSSHFFRQIGSTLGVALFGSLLTQQLSAHLGRQMGGMDLDKLQSLAATAQISALPMAAKLAITNSVTTVFGMGIPLVCAGAIFVILIPELRLRDRSVPSEGEGVVPPMPTEAHA